ncbi:ABC transporter ATP-binding protein [Lactobacillus delbrueckii subsp. bulgaricus]|nr:heme ABC transporter ATP-binding protein [Lactobacillus delbrueckii subsp. bulgaricus]MBT8909537.1 heme ABC transporter ATP-binding protein [Lactobacillus delbrueckii subsp. bulgaricus]MBT8912143.1 heme ABC transporter ATP-binding protein [Lactobacillus delbrueckii subsp. bulgaricus]MBT8923388.1 heme ABC transporter ATP-binding protein [Lactobacillus delbrueckii subsp. bulgaricus]
MTSLIQFRDFSFQYDSQQESTLHNINLTIEQGEKVLLAGPSGSGKSTLGKCLNGLIPNLDKGTITGQCLIDGKDISQTGLFDLSFTTSTILQDTDAQFIGLTVGEDIAFSLENDCVPQDKMKQVVDRWAKELDLGDLLKQAPQSLSGGQKQRVALAGVLVDESPILLFDEPLANLDPASCYKTMRLIDQMQKKFGATVIIIEHRLEEVLAEEVDRIVLVDDGRILADQKPDDLLKADRLEAVGVRNPLYLDAMKTAGINLNKLEKLTPLEALPVERDAKDKLLAWQDSYQLPAEKAAVKELLTLKNVGFAYSADQKYPLKDVNAVIKEGDFISIVGQNGAGKTTLCRLICGFLQKNTGEIAWQGEDMAGLSIKERADKIGYVMQDPNQMISQTMIFDEVALGLRLRKVPEDEVKERVGKVLKICGLYPFRNWPVSALSFGQKKRVTIAAILVLEPDLLILDEPTAGQDWKTYTEIMSFLQKLNAAGKTIMIITHDMHLMMEYTDRSLVFAKGRLIADTTPVALLTDEKLVEQASLRRVSLFDLAQHYGLPDPDGFARKFAAYERERLGENANE